jgi:hypothetical protein
MVSVFISWLLFNISMPHVTPVWLDALTNVSCILFGARLGIVLTSYVFVFKSAVVVSV